MSAGARSVAVAFAALAFAIGSSQYAFGLLVPPIENTFGWSRTQISASLSFTALGGLAAPLLGRWMDRHGVRPVLTGSLVLMAASFLLRPLMSELWHWFALSALQFVAFAGATGLAAGKLVGTWYAHSRGRVMGLVTTGNNFGGLVLPPLVAVALATGSWEGAYLTLGAIGLVIALLAYLFVRDAPETPAESHGPGAAPRAPATPAWTPREALRSSAFYVIFVAIGLGFFTYSTVLPHITAHLISRGVATAQASAILGVLAVLGICGKLGFGLLAERIGARRAMMINLTGQALFVLTMIPAGSGWSAWAAVPAFGLFMGGFGVIHTLVIQESFGMRHFGSIMGLVNVASVVSFGLGPLIAGLSYDLSGSYGPALAVVAALFAIAVLVLALGPRAELAAPSSG